MSETVLIRPRGTDDDTLEFVREPFRPAQPSGGPGVWLRQVAGIDETVLDWVPEERPRYTRLGAIVINTAMMAALSMLVLLSSVNLPLALRIPVALLWGYVILSFDGWLVASTHGGSGLAKMRIFLPRLFISILMGAVIAEPLLLWVFAPAIKTEINNERSTALGEYQSRLKDCNPLDGSAPRDPAGCTTEYILNVAGSPGVIRQSLDAANAKLKADQSAVDAINAELTRREDLAHMECNGTKFGNQTTGNVGIGPRCTRDRQEADRYRESSGLVERTADVDADHMIITKLQNSLDSANTTYASALAAEIKRKVDQKMLDQERPGILDQDKALEALAQRSGFVMVGSWLLRLLLVVVDCLPVLTKMMSRTTTYDGLLSRQLSVSSRLHEKFVIEREGHDAGLADVKIKRNEQAVHTQMEQIAERTRSARADKEASLDDEIEKLAARLRGEPWPPPTA